MALHRRHQRFEPAHKFGAKGGVAVEVQRPGKAVGRGDGHADGGRELVDRQGRNLQRVLQHEVGDLAVRTRQPRQGLRNALCHGGARVVDVGAHAWGRAPEKGCPMKMGLQI